MPLLFSFDLYLSIVVLDCTTELIFVPASQNHPGMKQRTKTKIEIPKIRYKMYEWINESI